MVMTISQEKLNVVESLGFDVADAKEWSYKYSVLKNNVPQRGVKLKLTFKQYMKLAKKAGLVRPSNIGRSSGKYQMSRKGDTGDYEWGNCRFLTMEENLAEQLANGGIDRSAEKQRGRTKFTHEHLRRAGEKRKGRTKDNHEGVARAAAKLRGRTAENHLGVARATEKRSHGFKLVDPEGQIHRGTNLRRFCLENDLNPGNMHNVCAGVARQAKGWTGKYVQKKHAKSAHI